MTDLGPIPTGVPTSAEQGPISYTEQQLPWNLMEAAICFSRVQCIYHVWFPFLLFRDLFYLSTLHKIVSETKKVQWSDSG